MKLKKFSCPGCGKPSEIFMMPCTDCDISMRFRPGPTCSLCSSDLAGSDNPCPVCRENPPIIDGLKSAGPWSGILREWLSSLKYGGDTRMADYLADLIYARWNEEWSGIPIVPVPPRFNRIFRTGIDPVDLIAKALLRRGVPLKKFLIRKGGVTQKSLNREDRISGAALSFRFRKSVKKIKGDFVILDDVTTTGATIDSCAALLKTRGATRVYGLVVCRD